LCFGSFNGYKAGSHGLIIGTDDLGMSKLYFSMVWVNCVREQRGNFASLAQASPSRLSESCKTSFLVLVRASCLGDLCQG